MARGKEKLPDTGSLSRGASKKVKDKPNVVESDQAYEEAGPNVVWETHRVTLHKAPTFGFGIAVSGGRDSPHFANGDPSVAISDVLKAGPAEGKLQINDRIVTVNGTSLENVDHGTAINVLRDCGNTVTLVVRRRILLPSMPTVDSTPPFKITLNKKNKKDEFGVVLGCRLYIREISPNSLAAQEATLREGDTVLKINNTPVENISVADARKLVEKTKDRLQLIVRKERQEERGAVGGAVGGIDADLLPSRVRDKDDVNLYRPSVRSEDDLYLKDAAGLGPGLAVPAGAYPNSENTRYDGHYVLDNDLPPRPVRELENGLPYGPSDGRDGPSRHNNGYLSDTDHHSGFYPPSSSLPRAPAVGAGGPAGFPGAEDDDVFARGPGNNNLSVHERYVDMRSDIRLEPRQVSFPKDKQTGLGLRLAGGNATGIFIASVQPGSAGEREGLAEGDNILMANEKEISGLTREEAVSYLTSLTGQVSMLVQYRKEDYDRIMASHEAGDSFYVRAHFSHTATDPAMEHSFQTGDVFHVKDTHFRGGGAWLALKVSEDMTEIRKGTIPNNKTAEILKSQQRDEEGDKDGGGGGANFPNRGRGSLFKRKSSRRSKSLGKDHWDQVVFDNEEDAGINTKFPAYERVVFTEPGFVRPVVIYGAIADIARERLLAEYPDRFECPQVEKSASGEKKEKSAIIRLGAIRDAVAQRKHCLLDITPSNVDRLNYAQYNPIVVYLRAENKQCVKDVRGRWKTGGGAGGARNPRKLLEQSEKLEREYPHLFTGVLKHMGTDAWFPKLCEMIDAQQRQPIWMSEVKPLEDISDDFMFPMSTRLSYAATGGGGGAGGAGGGADSDMELPSRGHDFSPGQGVAGSHGHLAPPGQGQGPRLVRSSSDPSINTQENIPGIPPYPSPPTYKNQRIPSDSRYSVSEASQRSHRDDYQMHPEDRYYPSYYTDHQVQASRANIDPYATLTPSERLRPRVSPGHFAGGPDEFSPYRDQSGGGAAGKGMGSGASSQPGISDIPNGMQSQGLPGQSPEHKGQAEGSTHSNDSYNRYTLGSPLNKHDDTKLREKLASSLKTGGGPTSTAAAGPGPSTPHDPYRFTRSTANPVGSTGGVVDKAKLSDLQARYRKQDGPGSKNVQKPAPGSPSKKKEPPPVPVKTFSLRQRGVGLESDEMKMRNYENSNRAYNYTDVKLASGQTPPLPPPPSSSAYPGPAADPPYEYMSVRQAQNAVANGGQNNLVGAGGEGSRGSRAEYPMASASSPHLENSAHHQQQQQQRYLQQAGRASSFDSSFPQGPPPPIPPPPDLSTTDSYNNSSLHQQQQQHQQQYHSPSPQHQQQQHHHHHHHHHHQQQQQHQGHPTSSSNNSAAYTNEIYMDQSDMARARQRGSSAGNPQGNIPYPGQPQEPYPPPHNQQQTQHPGQSRYDAWLGDGRRAEDFPYKGAGGMSGPDRGTAAFHNRTDDEQLLELQRSRHRARSESRLADISRHQGPYAPNVPTGSGILYTRSSNIPTPGDASGSYYYFSASGRDSHPFRDGEVWPSPRANRSRSATQHHPHHQQQQQVSPGSAFSSYQRQQQQQQHSSPQQTTKTSAAPSPREGRAGERKETTAANRSLSVGSALRSGEPVTGQATSPGQQGGQMREARAVLEGNTGQEVKGEEGSTDVPDRHTVIATAKGVFTSAGGLLDSPETGVSIWIPEGAIRENHDQEIYFKVCQDNSLLPPLDAEKGETLLSPLVMCGPHGTEFLRPVELRLPHCASANPDNWSFALKSSDSPSGQTTEWQNMMLAGSDTKGRVDSNSVSILVDHF